MLLMVMMMLAAALVVMVLMVMIVMMVLRLVLFLFPMCFFSQVIQLRGQSLLLFHGFQDLLAADFLPIRGHDGCLGIVFSQQTDDLIDFLLAQSLHVAQDNGAGVFHLVHVEFAEVLQIHLRLLGIYHGGKAVQLNLLILQILHGDDNVGQFTHAGRFDENPIRMVLLDDLVQCLSEIPYQGAANASGIHLVNLNSGILQESLVYTDFSEFVLDQNDFLVPISFLNQLPNQRRLSGSQESGKNIYFRHFYPFFLVYLTPAGFWFNVFNFIRVLALVQGSGWEFLCFLLHTIRAEAFPRPGRWFAHENRIHWLCRPAGANQTRARHRCWRGPTKAQGLAGYKAPTWKPARSESGKEKELPQQLFSSY